MQIQADIPQRSEAGSVLLIPPGRTVLRQIPAGTHYVRISFDPRSNHLRPVVSSSGKADSIAYRTPSAQQAPLFPTDIWGIDLPIVAPPSLRDASFLRLREIAGIWWRGNGARLRANALLALMLADWVCYQEQGAAEQPDSSITVDESLVSRAEKHVQQHLPQSVQVADIARALGVSRPYLSRLYRAQRHISLGQFIRHERMLLAADLLRTGVDVATAAQRAGYNGTNALNRAFKLHYGMTPGQWQRDMRE